ncbi:MAG: hypothetical protein Tsb0019_35800 [Roseibium sp.]
MSGTEIFLECACAASAERLWRVLVSPSLWWGEGVRLDARAGGDFHEPWRDASGEHHTRGKVLEIEPPRRLRLSWGDDDWSFVTQVTFTLHPEGDGCRLDLRHAGWQDAPADGRRKLTDNHRAGWRFHLKNLIACAEGRLS